MLNHHFNIFYALSLASLTLYSSVHADTSTAYKGDNNMIAITSVMRPRQRSATEMPNNAWSVDVSHSGDFCYRQNSHINLWRSNAEQMDKLQLHGIDGTKISLRWPIDQHELVWPQAKLPLQSDSAYTLRLSKTSEVERQITMHQIPDDLVIGSQELNTWMSQNGCHLQAAVLAKQP